MPNGLNAATQSHRCPAWAVGVVVALVASACSGDGESPSSSEGSPSAPNGAPDPPGQIEAELVGDGAEERLEVSFPRSPDAQAHVVVLDGAEQPVRLTAEDCAEGACRVRFDRLSASTATSASVMAVADGQTSSPAEAELPDWPVPPEPDEVIDLEGDEPIPVVVTRADASGGLTVETSTIPPGDDIEARLADIGAAEDVVGVGVDLPGLLAAQGDEVDEDDEDDGMVLLPEDLLDPEYDPMTWQQEMLNYEDLPGEPSQRGAGVTVAVIDTGANLDHPALQGADIWQANIKDPGEIVPADHATGVTSLIAGQPEGRVRGIAPAASIRIYDVVSSTSSLSFSDSALIEAVIQAVDDGADVINMSLSSACFDEGPIEIGCPGSSLQTAIEYAESKGVVTVAAAGNDGDEGCPGVGDLGPLPPPNRDRWPAKYPSVIAVGMALRDGTPASCSPDKDYLDVIAPGVSLLAAQADGDYAVVKGSSFSAPLVSGLIAVILAERPDLTPEEIRGLISRSLAEHQRLVPSALLLELDLHPDHQPVDPTTGARIVPFSIEFRREVDSAVGSRHLRDVYGLLMIDEDGGVSGSGRVVISEFTEACLRRNTGGGVFVPVDGCGTGRGYVASCAYSNERGRIDPYMAFYWNTPVVVGGEVVDDRESMDLSFSFGLGATPQEAGELSPVIVTHDDMDRCPSDAKVSGGPRGEGLPESHDDLSTVVNLHELDERELVELSPMTLSELPPDDFLARPDGAIRTYQPNDRLRMDLILE